MGLTKTINCTVTQLVAVLSSHHNNSLVSHTTHMMGVSLIHIYVEPKPLDYIDIRPSKAFPIREHFETYYKKKFFLIKHVHI